MSALQDAPRLSAEEPAPAQGTPAPPKNLDFYTVEMLKKEGRWPQEYSPVKELLPYIRRLGQDVTGLEIGTERGESAYLILEECPNVKLLWTVDAYKEYENWNGIVKQDVLDKYLEIAKQNLEPFGERAEIITVPSSAVLPTKPDALDFIFIDGSVDENQYYADLCKGYQSLRKGGLFAGHNFQLKSVRNALERFRESEKVRIQANRTENMTFFWIKR